MSSYLADTNVLLRVADTASGKHAVATQALARLLGRGDDVYVFSFLSLTDPHSLLNASEG